MGVKFFGGGGEKESEEGARTATITSMMLLDGRSSENQGNCVALAIRYYYVSLMHNGLIKAGFLVSTVCAVEGLEPMYWPV